MKRLPNLPAVLTLSLLLPGIAQAQDARITPVLSTTMQRICTVEKKVSLHMERGEVIPDPQPTTTLAENRLRVSQSATRWIFKLDTTAPEGDIDLTFETTLDGARVTDARSATPALSGRTDLLMALADDLSERLVAGRSFRIGDPLYPRSIADTLLNRMSSARGMPFDVVGSFDTVFQGEVSHQGRRAWRFAGPISADATASVAGTHLKMNFRIQGETLIDADTGLTLSSTITENSYSELNGAPFRRQTKITSMTCELLPQ